MEASKKLGLSLSGGGYRAAAFHLGTLKKLNELKILEKVDVLSTISGGSITGAAWCLHKGSYKQFHNQFRNELLSKNTILYLVLSPAFLAGAILILGSVCLSLFFSLTRLSWLSFPIVAAIGFILYKYQYIVLPTSSIIEKAYDKFFFNHATLSNLRKRPALVIGSSNLHTGRLFTFSQDKMRDTAYRNIVFKHTEFPVSRAVMASSCVPFAFSPVGIDQQFYEVPKEGKNINPQLIDGGVYDNQGIQKLTQEKGDYSCDIIITSDAGGSFMADKKYPNTIALLIRTVDLFMYRIKGVQMQKNIYDNVALGARPIAYFSLGWELERCISGFVNNLAEGNVLPEVLSSHELEPAWTKNPEKFRSQIEKKLKEITGFETMAKLSQDQWEIARRVGTNLTPLKQKTLDYLIQHAENLTEIQVKLYCPSLLL